MNKIYSWIARQVIGRMFSGKGTVVLGWITTALGVFQIIASTDNVQALCASHNICLDGNPVYGAITMVVAEAMKILRFRTGQQYHDTKFIK